MLVDAYSLAGHANGTRNASGRTGPTLATAYFHRNHQLDLLSDINDEHVRWNIHWPQRGDWATATAGRRARIRDTECMVVDVQWRLDAADLWCK
jgi:hypothetical protein